MKQPWWTLLIVAVLAVGLGVGAATLIGGDGGSVAITPTATASTSAAPPTPPSTAAPTTVPSTTTAPTTAPPTTTTTPPTTAPAEPEQPPLEDLQIVVANAAGVSGLAASTAQVLRDIGYPNVEVADADELAPSTAAYAAEGIEPTATRLIADMLVVDPEFVESTVVTPLAELPAIAPAFPDAAVILFLGEDQT